MQGTSALKKKTNVEENKVSNGTEDRVGRLGRELGKGEDDGRVHLGACLSNKRHTCHNESWWEKKNSKSKYSCSLIE
jgi:hypothetical protein